MNERLERLRKREEFEQRILRKRAQSKDYGIELAHHLMDERLSVLPKKYITLISMLNSWLFRRLFGLFSYFYLNMILVSEELSARYRCRRLPTKT